MTIAPAKGPKHCVEISPAYVCDSNIEIPWCSITLPFIVGGDCIAESPSKNVNLSSILEELV
jgi:hypothetical protein